MTINTNKGKKDINIKKKWFVKTLSGIKALASIDKKRASANAMKKKTQYNTKKMFFH